MLKLYKGEKKKKHRISHFEIECKDLTLSISLSDSFWSCLNHWQWVDWAYLLLTVLLILGVFYRLHLLEHLPRTGTNDMVLPSERTGNLRLWSLFGCVVVTHLLWHPRIPLLHTKSLVPRASATDVCWFPGIISGPIYFFPLGHFGSWCRVVIFGACSIAVQSQPENQVKV